MANAAKNIDNGDDEEDDGRWYWGCKSPDFGGIAAGGTSDDDDDNDNDR